MTLLRELHQVLFVLSLFVLLPASLAWVMIEYRNYTEGRRDR
jgi:hypothetical protein